MVAASFGLGKGRKESTQQHGQKVDRNLLGSGLGLLLTAAETGGFHCPFFCSPGSFPPPPQAPRTESQNRSRGKKTQKETTEGSLLESRGKGGGRKKKAASWRSKQKNQSNNELAIPVTTRSTWERESLNRAHAQGSQALASAPGSSKPFLGTQQVTRE